MEKFKISNVDRKKIESLFINSLTHLIKCKCSVKTNIFIFNPIAKDLINFEKKKEMYRKKAKEKN